jgi:SAM-dependent methyltransferase
LGTKNIFKKGRLGSKTMVKFLLPKSDRSIQHSWEWMGEFFPSLTGAPSTQYYLECEKELFRSFLPDFQGKRILKTDLWDEAKNTQILKWVAKQGSEVFGLDISFSIVSKAKLLFKSHEKKGFIVSDLRNIAYADESFDYIYSMGTIEHFRQSFQALKECFRVLRKGGKAIFGVPNKNDPFLRPLMVFVLQKLGLYAFGYEKSFSRKKLEIMLKEAGFRIVANSGILFMPGQLRMLDLFLHVLWPKSTFLTMPVIFPFAFLYKKLPFLRRHGYLIACIVERP